MNGTWPRRALATAASCGLFVVACAPKLPPPLLPLSPTPNAAFRQSAPAVTDSPDLVLPDILHVHLKNGLDVYMVERHDSPVVSMRYINQRVRGADARTVELAATEARLMMESGKLQRFGFVPSISSDSVGFSGETTTENAIPALEELGNELTHPPPYLDDFAAMKATVLRQVQALSWSPRLAVEAHSWRRLLGPNYPSGSTAMEVKKRVESWTLEEVARIAARYLAPNGSALVLVGDIDPVAVKATLAADFDGWQPGPNTSVPDPTPVPRSGSLIQVVFRPSSQTTIAVGSPAPDARSPDEIPFLLMRRLLATSPSSRLFRALRHDSGNTYGIESSYAAESGAWFIETNVNATSVNESIDGILAGFEKLRTTGPSEDELRGARTAFIENQAAALERPDSLANAIRSLIVFNRSKEWWPEARAAALRTTPDDIRRIAAAYLDPERIVITVAGFQTVIGSQLQWTHYPVEFISPK